jgi:hypothetical protein
MKNQTILALDPGTDQTAYVVLSDHQILQHGILPNTEMIAKLRQTWFSHPDRILCEMIASYGMPVGRETFETVLWIGRFDEAVGGMELVYRKDIKMHLCGSARAKDGNIRQALLDKIGQQGTKKAPGATYGIKSHEWAALAVAVYGQEKEGK